MAKRHAQEELQSAMLKVSQVTAQLREAELRGQEAEQQLAAGSSSQPALAAAQVRLRLCMTFH